MTCTGCAPEPQELMSTNTDCVQGSKSVASTWITVDMLEAYVVLHDHGYAHSVEVWSDTGLAGGLYGISLGSGFFAESMFSWAANASKIALISLSRLLEKKNMIIVGTAANAVPAIIISE